MDMLKIGKFIADCRKKKNLTQLDLAEKLNITDRAVSKWECGRAMPDSAIMLELCELLGISVNELLSGEVLDMKDYNKQADKNLIEMKKQKEESDKRLLNMEIALGYTASISFLTLVFVASFVEMQTWLRLLLIGIGLVIFFISCFICLRIEQKAGYYECSKCHHRYVPTYKQINLSMHMGRTRYMKCPHCGEKSWNKKVLSENDGRKD
ncbi:MAG: helix-turn-helix transcriptional regulator [Clostridia bacterium]|nr:helix-turn-helix transcriptional regulator [Clostridia bacterium]